MMARRGLLGLIAGGGVLLLAGCGLFGGNSYRFRMTVEVETPEGLRTGSSVMEVTARKLTKFTSEERSGASWLTGEAVVVDLPGGPLFALLKNDDAGQPLSARVTSVLSGQASFRDVDDYVAAVGALGGLFADAHADLPRADYPLLVAFRDLDDPRSVERVDPANLAARFGPGVRLKRITVETTDDDVTSGIEKRLRWLVAAGNFHYAGTPYGDIYPMPVNAFRSGME